MCNLDFKRNALFLAWLALQRSLKQVQMLQFQSPPVQITRSLKAKWQDQAGFQDSRSEMSQTSRTSVQAKWQWFMILPNDVLDLDTELFPRLGLVKK